MRVSNVVDQVAERILEVSTYAMLVPLVSPTPLPGTVDGISTPAPISSTVKIRNSVSEKGRRMIFAL